MAGSGGESALGHLDNEMSRISLLGAHVAPVAHVARVAFVALVANVARSGRGRCVLRCYATLRRSYSAKPSNASPRVKHGRYAHLVTMAIW